MSINVKRVSFQFWISKHFETSNYVKYLIICILVGGACDAKHYYYDYPAYFFLTKFQLLNRECGVKYFCLGNILILTEERCAMTFLSHWAYKVHRDMGVGLCDLHLYDFFALYDFGIIDYPAHCTRSILSKMFMMPLHLCERTESFSPHFL